MDVLQIVDSLLSGRSKLDVNFQDTIWRSALWYAVDTEGEDLVLYFAGLEEIEIDLNSFDQNGFTPPARAAEKGSWHMHLWAACRAGQILIVELFLGQTSININQESPTGTSPLQVALSMDHLSIEFLLLNRKSAIEVNHKDWSGLTALMYASIKGNLQVIELLLKDINVNVNLFDNSKRTALWYAAAGGHLKVVRLLITNCDIEIHMADKSNSTAEDVAYSRGQSHISQFL
ncbi:Ankyrin repeat domain-containing protein 60 [Penicillium rubens]|nr:Ankyrin repeat domain-containing protein 60 [Penicillium rubens]